MTQILQNSLPSKWPLDWVKERKWPNCIMLSDSAIVVDNVMGITRIRNRYTNITSICRESMKEGCVMWVQKVEKDQVSKADALAKTVKKEDPQYHDFLHFFYISLEGPKSNELKYFL